MPGRLAGVVHAFDRARRTQLLKADSLQQVSCRPSATVRLLSNCNFTVMAEGEDNLKKMQLMELAILNGTYRDNNIKTPAAAAAQGPRLIAAPTGQVLPPPALRPPTPAGAPIMNLIRPTQMAAMLPNGTPTLVPPTPDGGLIYTTPYEYPYALAPTSLLEYPIEHSGVLGKRAWGSMGAAGTATNFSQPGQEGSLFYPGIGVLDAASMSHSQDLLKGAMATKVRRHDTRVHPYQRIVTADRGQLTFPPVRHVVAVRSQSPSVTSHQLGQNDESSSPV
ncbi:Protein quaking-A [Nibea albiflora]|uniref:Protein quaking-A n=1 Tax=Nibea albiflora TaxID=240163 RepID=A0ACB7FFI5_NIBAL|nr:Protein quaking-A [Nibea albiflora]